MKEYIKRAAAMDAILGLTIADPAVAQYADAVCYHLQNLPAADVVEVRHGRWIPEACESVSKRNRLIEYRVYSCSICGRSNGRVKKRYCPNCGALMREIENGEK